jgi:hypothetical protein
VQCDVKQLFLLFNLQLEIFLLALQRFFIRILPLIESLRRKFRTTMKRLCASGRENLRFGLEILQPNAISLHLVFDQADCNRAHFILGQEGMKLRKSAAAK